MSDRSASAPFAKDGADRRRVRRSRLPQTQLVLLNDDEHTYKYVVDMLERLFGHTRQKAWRIVRRMERDGRAIIDTTTFEHAEFKRDQIHAYGPDWRLDRRHGSMTAELHPAEAAMPGRSIDAGRA